MLRLADEEYRSVYSKTPRLCVDLMVSGSNGTFILTKREIEPFSGLWHFPGGRVGYKESIQQAFHRIAKAELGIEVTMGKLVGYCDVIDDGEYVHSVSLVFEATPLSTAMTGSEQAHEITWFSSPPENTHPYHKDFINNLKP